MMIISIPVTGVPDTCPHCGLHTAFALSAFAGQVRASCPACYEVIAAVVVSSSQEGGSNG